MTSRFLRDILTQPRLPRKDIPAYVIDKLTGKPSEASSLKMLWQYRKGSIRHRYAVYGKNSGLKPGICWPSKEELEFKKKYQQTFEKSFQQMSDNLKAKQAAELETRTKREKEIKKNLAKLPQMKAEFWKSYHQLHEDIEKEKIKKEKVIQEVREFLGYDIDPKDPRFEEALLKKDEEEKAAMRAARKLEKQRQQMELLQTLVSEALEKEKESNKKAADSATKTVPAESDEKKNVS